MWPQTPLCEEDIAKYSLNPKEEMTIVCIRMCVLSLSCCRNHWWLSFKASHHQRRGDVTSGFEYKRSWKKSAWKHVCVCVYCRWDWKHIAVCKQTTHLSVCVSSQSITESSSTSGETTAQSSSADPVDYTCTKLHDVFQIWSIVASKKKTFKHLKILTCLEKEEIDFEGFNLRKHW